VRQIIVLDARDDHRAAGVGDLADPSEDLLLRADVDALRRFVNRKIRGRVANHLRTAPSADCHR
jgi:hypothetical protein